MRLLPAIFVLISFISSAPAAETIDPKCKRSEKVKNIGVSLSNMTVSCVALEKYKTSIFEHFDSLASSAFDLSREITRLEAELLKAEKAKDWATTMVGASVVGNFISTVGLASCLETLGGGCALAAIGAAISKLSILDSGSTLAEKQSASEALRGQLVKARTALKTETPRQEAKDRLAKEFNSLCNILQTRCK